MKKLGLLMTAAALMALAACSSTKLTSSWRTPDARLQQDKKIMVVALVPAKEQKLRALMEDNLVTELKKEGFNAVSALAAYGPNDALSKASSEKAALQQFRNSDVDQVMTIAMVNKSREKNYVPGGWYSPYYPGFYGGFWPYYSMWYGRMYDPGYYQVNTRYNWESNLYDLRDRKLIYSAQTASVDPPSAYRQAYLYARQIVKDMQKQQLIAKN